MGALFEDRSTRWLPSVVLREGAVLYDYSILDPEQESLLAQLVEAEKRVPRAERHHFVISKTMRSGPRVELLHGGWPAKHPGVFEGDLDILASAGFLAISFIGNGGKAFTITPQGFSYYEDMMLRRGQPLDRVQVRTREFIVGEVFQKRYPAAFAKWCAAEELLWGEDSSANYTTIGHLAREAMQEFATALVDQFRPKDVEKEKARTKNRLRAVLHLCSSNLGSTELDFLDALLKYWDAVNLLVQRQEHGGQREGSPLTWPDTRRVVFQVAVVILEIDASLEACRPRG